MTTSTFAATSMAAFSADPILGPSTPDGYFPGQTLSDQLRVLNPPVVSGLFVSDKPPARISGAGGSQDQENPFNYLKQVRRLRRSCDNAAALKAIEQAIAMTDASDSSLAIFYTEKAFIHIHLEQYDQSLEAAERSLQIQVHPLALFSKARALLGLERCDEALAVIDLNVERKGKVHTRALQLKADILKRLGRDAEAHDCEERLATQKHDRDTRTQLFEEARRLRKEGNRDGALELIDQAIAMSDPSDSALGSFYGEKSLILVHSEQFGQALEAAERSLHVRVRPETLFSKASALLGLERFEEALEAIDASLAEQKNPSRKSLQLKAHIIRHLVRDALSGDGELPPVIQRHNRSIRYHLIEEARRLRNSGDPDTALELIEQSIAICTSSDSLLATAYNEKLIILLHRKQYRLALKAAELSLQIRSHPVPLFYKARVLMRLACDKEALVAIDRSLELQKEPDFMPFNLKATLLKKLGRDDEALEARRQALEVESRNPMSVYSQARRLMSVECYEEALTAIDMALELDKTSDPNFLQSKVILLLRLGRDDEALDYEIQYFEAETPGRVIPRLIGMARVHRKRGEYKKALRVINHVIARDDGGQFSRRRARDVFHILSSLLAESGVEIRPHHRYLQARLYHRMGQTEKAFYTISLAIKGHEDPDPVHVQFRDLLMAEL